MKKNNNGFMLVETLIVTAFVAGVLIFLFVQFNNLNRGYKSSFNYNGVETQYALEDIMTYIKKDSLAFSYLKDNIGNLDFITLTDCSIFTSVSYCEELISLNDIDEIIFTKQDLSSFNYDNSLPNSINNFIKKIKYDDNDSMNYRLIAKFNNDTYSTVLVKIS